jgi:hypothetical protein
MAREICLSLPVGKLEETGQRYLINVIRILRYINYRKKKIHLQGRTREKICETIETETNFKNNIFGDYSISNRNSMKL